MVALTLLDREAAVLYKTAVVPNLFLNKEKKMIKRLLFTRIWPHARTAKNCMYVPNFTWRPLLIAEWGIVKAFTIGFAFLGISIYCYVDYFGPPIKIVKERIIPDPLTCVVCGKESVPDYVDKVRDELIAKQRCFNCNFWLNHAEADKNPEEGVIPVVFEGRHYRTHGITDGCGLGVGYGGSPFVFTRLDGTTFTSNNVWHQGHIPAHLLYLFRDTVTQMESQWAHDNPEEMAEIAKKTYLEKNKIPF